ncbi:MAG: hypothetical protein Q9167_006533 [Letrouitia subvulpina]
MAASQIPNLSLLRRGHGRPLGRGRGVQPNIPTTATSGEDGLAKDKIIQQTDQDATVSRLSAVEAGYFDDPFAKLFVTSEAQRRFPIINRGTYVRTAAIDKLILSFLAEPCPAQKQIISLGAGSDTRYFRIMTHHPQLPPFAYHELDFPSNTSQKIAAISRSSRLRDLLSSFTVSQDGTALDSATFHISPIDLRTLPLFPSKSGETLPARPEALNAINPALPSLLISECCLIYLSPQAADNAIFYFTRCLFPSSIPLGLILYEPISPHDAFGKVMVSNLAARGIVLQTLKRYGSLEAQKERLRMYGFSEGEEASTVDDIWEMVGEVEKERVAVLEMMDEVEEWRLLAGHYCVAWGWRSGNGDGDGKGVWDGWKSGRDTGLAKLTG